MAEVIVDRDHPITLLGAGQATPTDLHEALKLAPTCLAADGGALLALSEGLLPEAVIGDFDSLPPAALAQLRDVPLITVEEQESTDFEKALMRIRAPLILGLGFLGARLDHQMAAFHALMRFAHQPTVLLGAVEVVFLAPPRLELSTRAGDRVSLFPLAPVTGRSTGLAWPIEGLSFAPGVRIGTSNVATGPLTLETAAPSMLVILPRRLMPEVVVRLSDAEAARWPAPRG
ncbi:MAG: thiamine diphosphokinase [Sulfitobacter sp.]|nr:thiamine diphosphokinase [Sulfitobacter sp.]